MPNVHASMTPAITARGLTGFTNATPAWAESIKLPGSNGEQLWPPSAPLINPAMFVPQEDPRRYSGEWWKFQEQGTAEHRREIVRTNAYYDNQFEQREARQNEAARARLRTESLFDDLAREPRPRHAQLCRFRIGGWATTSRAVS